MRTAIAAAAAVMLALIAVGQPAFADPLDFDFTFTGDAVFPGTVSGEIEGLTNNATSAATAVFVTSATIPSPISPTYNTVQNASLYNSFTVTNGVITAVSFYANNVSTYGLILGTVAGEAQNRFVNFSTGQSISNFEGVSGITFTPVAQPVAEPGSLALLGTGLLALGLVGFASRRRMTG